MRLRVRESDYSTPEAPRFAWSLWRDGRAVASGIESSREAAQQAGLRRTAELQQEARKRWQDSLWGGL